MASKKEVRIKTIDLKGRLKGLIKEKEEQYKHHLDMKLYGNLNKRHMRPSRVPVKQQAALMGKKSMPLRKRKLD